MWSFHYLMYKNGKQWKICKFYRVWWWKTRNVGSRQSPICMYRRIVLIQLSRHLTARPPPSVGRLAPHPPLPPPTHGLSSFIHPGWWRNWGGDSAEAEEGHETESSTCSAILILRGCKSSVSYKVETVAFAARPNFVTVSSIQLTKMEQLIWKQNVHLDQVLLFWAQLIRINIFNTSIISLPWFNCTNKFRLLYCIKSVRTWDRYTVC